VTSDLRYPNSNIDCVTCVIPSIGSTKHTGNTHFQNRVIHFTLSTSGFFTPFFSHVGGTQTCKRRLLPPLSPSLLPNQLRPVYTDDTSKHVVGDEKGTVFKRSGIKTD